MIKGEKIIWKEIFTEWRYIATTLVSAFLFYALNGFILNIPNLGSASGFGLFGSVKFYSILFLNIYPQVALHSFVTILVISLMIGILVSLITYKVKNRSLNGKNWGFFPTIGTFLAAFAPGCAACGIGLVAILGFSGAIVNFLPFDGLEISLLSILILGIAIFKISRNLGRPINYREKMRRDSK